LLCTIDKKIRNLKKTIVLENQGFYNVDRFNKTERKMWMDMRKLYKDQVLGIILIVVAVFFGALTMGIAKSTLQGDPGPKVFPATACIMIGLCGLFLFAKPERKEGKRYLSPEEWKRLAVLYGLYLLYWALLWLVGYRVAIPVILFLVSTLFARGTNTKPVKTLLYTVVLSAVIYVIYIVVMESRLPEGILFEKFLG